jgi:hypothetical protein
MNPKEIVLKHKEFITAIALYKLVPQRDNVNLIELVNAWKQVLKEIGSKVVVGSCDSCGNGSLSAVKDLYVYAVKNNWFNENFCDDVKKKTGRPKRSTV